MGYWAGSFTIQPFSFKKKVLVPYAYDFLRHRFWLCESKNEFLLIEQDSNLIRKQLIFPINSLYTILPVSTSYLADLYCYHLRSSSKSIGVFSSTALHIAPSRTMKTRDQRSVLTHRGWFFGVRYQQCVVSSAIVFCHTVIMANKDLWP